MNINKAISIFSLLLLISCSDRVESQNQYPDEKVKVFFEGYQSNYKEAIIALIKQNSSIPQESGDNLILSLKDYNTKAGKYFGYEIISRKLLGSTLCVYSVIAKYERLPLRFNLIYYKPNNKWVIQKISFDTDLNEELLKSTQLFLLKEVYSQ